MITVKKCDITTLQVDAIVNAANSSLLGGGGVDGAIHRAAGPELLSECRTLSGCRTGEAKITKGYKLPAKYVIHTVGPIYHQCATRIDAGIYLSQCYMNSMDLAKENDIHSIAFPAISTGVYGYPLKEATGIAVAEVDAWIKRNPEYQMDVIFSCFDSETESTYKKAISRLEEKKVSSIFEEEYPGGWAARGNPYFWEHLKNIFENYALPMKDEDFIEIVREEFQNITGHDFRGEESYYVEEFAHGGMSSGVVTTEFWMKSALPELLRRLSETY